MVAAAVLTAPGSPLEVLDVTPAPVGPGRVRVRVAAAGVCHSDLSLATGVLRQPVPAVLGHEGAGTVTEVGDGVTRVAVGDPVVLCWAPPCRQCALCTRGEPWLCERAATDPLAAPYGIRTDTGEPLHPGLGTGCWAEEVVVLDRQCVRVDPAVPLELAALVGCAVTTGVGAIRHAAKVQPSQTVLVIGLGGVGLSAVQGARLAGASQILVADPAPDKLELAATMGATDLLAAGDDLPSRVRRATGGLGVDVAVEAVGRGSTIKQAWASTRRGGTAVALGVGRKDDPVPLSALEVFHFARTLIGCVYGSADPDVDFPFLVAEQLAGRLDLAALVTDRIGLDGVQGALDAMAAGQGARAVVTF